MDIGIWFIITGAFIGVCTGVLSWTMKEYYLMTKKEIEKLRKELEEK